MSTTTHHNTDAMEYEQSLRHEAQRVVEVTIMWCVVNWNSFCPKSFKPNLYFFSLNSTNFTQNIFQLRGFLSFLQPKVILTGESSGFLGEQ